MINWKNKKAYKQWNFKFKNIVDNGKSKKQTSEFDDFYDSENEVIVIDDDDEIITIDEYDNKYYNIKDGKIFLTFSGLHVYLSIELIYLNDEAEHLRWRDFYSDITGGLIDIIEEYRQKELNLKNNLISGLN